MQKVTLTDKGYVHFDRRTRARVYEELVSDPEWVEHHAFYPFVHCEMERGRFSKDNGYAPKFRELFYSAHVDSYIYQYYGKLLNDRYNEYAKELGIDENSIAYRNCWYGKSNIEFADEVFEFISAQPSAYIYVTDLTDFFGTLDHKYLKKQLKKMLGVEALDGANYAVFKSVTKCAYVDRKQIEEITGLKYRDLKEKDRFFETKEFRALKSKLIKHWGDKGIPQGTAVSSVYANIYMTDFDKAMTEYVSAANGLYRRYCDDIIIVLPMSREELEKNITEVEEFIAARQSEVPEVEINREKTEHYFYENQTIKSLQDNLEDGQCQKSKLSYLGFDFDGRRVWIRSKSIFKYYCRAYRKVKRVNSFSDEQSYIAGKKAVYNGYTHLYNPKRIKAKGKGHGNFYTYARKADAVFSKSGRLESLIRRQVRRHWKKIDSRLRW